MARKNLKDFNYDYDAFVDYLMSAECTNDDGYDVIADEYGNIYTPTDGDWTKGHGHKNEKWNLDRKPDDETSRGRPWVNRWLRYDEKLRLNEFEISLIRSVLDKEIWDRQDDSLSLEDKKLVKKR